MSETHAQKYHLYHSRLVDLLQGVRGRLPAFLVFLARCCGIAPTIHIEPLCIRVGLLVVWGVLVTARWGDEILSAWVIATKYRQPDSADLHRQGQARAADLSHRIEAEVRARHLRVQPGWYEVSEQAFRQVASFEEAPQSAAKGAAHDGH